MLRSDRKTGLLFLYNYYEDKKKIEDHTPSDPLIIPKTDVFELFGNYDAIYEGVYECRFGHTTEFEPKVLSNLVKELSAKRNFEIGTFKGRTTLSMVLNISENAEIITLDIPASELTSTKMEIEEGGIR